VFSGLSFCSGLLLASPDLPPLAPIHPSAWKTNSPKSASRIPHNPGPMGPVAPPTGPPPLDRPRQEFARWMDMRDSGFRKGSWFSGRPFR